MKANNKYRWFVVAVFFTFMLLHQTDKLLIGTMPTPIMETFGINKIQWGFILSGAMLVGAILYPVWGYLYDRFARSKLLALASFIWGSTTWLSAIAPTFPFFVVTRATTGIDDSSYPGLFSLISDYFGPKMRGKVYGLLQLTQPMGYLIGMLAGTLLSGILGWRALFYITGSLGLFLGIVIYFGVKEAPRGQSEPEMAELDQVGVYKFDKEIALGLFRKRSLLLLFAQGFIGVFPWNVIVGFFILYLESERHYDSQFVPIVMAPTIIVLAAGYFVGGAIGDYFFQHSQRGRLLVATFGVLLGAILFMLTLNVPNQNQTFFLVMMLLTALFIPFSSANVISTVYDITLPEVRSTALSIQYFIENGGAALAPIMAGFISESYSIRVAFLVICVTAWILTAILLSITAYLVPGDIQTLRDQMKERAKIERGRVTPADETLNA